MEEIVQRSHRQKDNQTCNVLIVEDQFLIAIDIQETVSASDNDVNVIGFASGRDHALRLGASADVAFVDVNLADGPTGPDIGRTLANQGVTVIFMTANPEALGSGVPGTLGVLTKPVSEESVEEALAFAIAMRSERLAIVPRQMRAFA